MHQSYFQLICMVAFITVAIAFIISIMIMYYAPDVPLPRSDGADLVPKICNSTTNSSTNGNNTSTANNTYS